MNINTNVNALGVSRHLNLSNLALKENFTRLSSGLRINSSKDDPAGMAMAEGLKAQFQALSQASRNIQDGLSFTQTAEGYLNSATDTIGRLRTLSLQASNGFLSENQRGMINIEAQELLSEIDRISQNAQFNSISFFNSSSGNPSTQDISSSSQNTPESEGYALNIFVGTQASTETNTSNSLRLVIRPLSNEALKVSDLDLSSVQGAQNALTALESALENVLLSRTEIGAFESRLERAQVGIDLAYENTRAAESRIRDLDFGTEMTDFVRNSLLQNVNLSLLTSANLLPQNVMYLFSTSGR